ncbi:MAG: hypothetical protein K2G83_04880 [Ruminococcus sp.]|nr:hypothetical protein [Ruminococcus sp.]
MQYGIHPNITTLAKNLGAGLPIGVVMMEQKYVSDRTSWLNIWRKSYCLCGSFGSS